MRRFLRKSEVLCYVSSEIRVQLSMCHIDKG